MDSCGIYIPTATAPRTEIRRWAGDGAAGVALVLFFGCLLAVL